MRASISCFCASAALMLTACGGGSGSDGGPDAAMPDGDVDAGAPDLGTPDLGADAGPPPSVTTSCGAALSGTRPRAGVRAFLGIPFAAPPMGANRFRPPQPAACPASPFDATRFGFSCPQTPTLLLTVPGGRSEDCLTLNVWTPDPMPATPVPVMVWIYGGGFTLGGTSQGIYDGANLAAQGVVVVSINYRLGAFGWLAHPALTAEDANHSSGDYGLLDQLQGLAWVRDEIVAFGGDTANVTLFGESAGALSTCALIGSPLADGLFEHAIIESGSCVLPPALATLGDRHLAEAETHGTMVADALGCSGADPAGCLRGKTVDELLAAQGTFDLSTGDVPYGPVIEGYVLPRSTRDRMLDPTFTPPPIVVGTNHDEGRLFSFMTTITNETEYEAAVTAFAGPNAAVALSLYPATDYPSPKDAFDAMVRDILFTCPARELARVATMRQSHVYLYEFAQVNGGFAALGFGATHASEIGYVFGDFTSPFTRATPDDAALSAAMQGYWTRFAATGDPNGGSALAWPAYTTATDTHVELETPISTAAGLRMAQCDGLAAIPTP